jgi:hypothetical protein
MSPALTVGAGSSPIAAVACESDIATLSGEEPAYRLLRSGGRARCVCGSHTWWDGDPDQRFRILVVTTGLHLADWTPPPLDLSPGNLPTRFPTTKGARNSERSGRAAEPMAEHKSLTEWPGQGWTESIAERRGSALDTDRSRADAQPWGRRLGGELMADRSQPVPISTLMPPGRRAVGVRAGAPAPERGGPLP